MNTDPTQYPVTLLHLEDNILDRELIHARLEREGFDLKMVYVTSREEFIQTLKARSFDLILADYVLPNFDGITALEIARELAPRTPFIFVSGTLGEEVAIDMLKHGATDYVVKHRMERLVPSVRRALSENQARRNYEQVEEALDESETQLRMALNAANMGTWRMDLMTQVATRDANLNQILGLEAKATTQSMSDFFDRLHEDDRSFALEAVRKAIEENKIYDAEFRIVQPNGAVRWLRDRGSVILKDGEAVCMTGVVADITERKHHENEIARLLDNEKAHGAQMERLARASLAINRARSLEKILTIVTEEARALVPSHQSVTSLTYDKEGSQRVDAISLSDKYAQWRSYDAKPSNKGIYTLVCKHNKPMRMTQADLESHPSWRNFSGQHGKHPPLRGWLAVPMISSDGRNLGLIQLSDRETGEFTAADEAALVQLASIASIAIDNVQLFEARVAADKRKDEFLANMSHELRTPMNAVVGLANILATSKVSPERQREFIDTLRLCSNALLSLINDLLDIAKIETNSIKLEHIPFKLQDLIGEIISVSSVKAREKHIALMTDSMPLNNEFIGDPLRIKQIISNLVSNAIKFTETGSVVISVSATPHENPQSRYVHINVRDTGVGIDSSKLDLIFEKFTQADASTTRKYGGTGLGLAISKSLAEIMGGAITVKSEPGSGSTFSLHLPLEIAQEACTPCEAQAERSIAGESIVTHGRLTVLLVEDYQPNILVASSVLERLGYSWEVAQNGHEALEKIREMHDRICVVLMDIQMPDMDGFEATRHIREMEEKRDLTRIPIVAMTAHALKGDRDKCLAAGMDDYVSKPFSPEELEEILTRFCGTREAKHEPDLAYA